MSRERNITYKKHERQKKREFEGTKASFVSGIIVIIAIPNACRPRIVPLPNIVNVIEIFFALFLWYLVLGTTKMDKVLGTAGVQKFGYFLTVYSVLLFLLERIYLNGATDKQLIMSLMNDRFQALVSFVVLGTLGIGGAIFLLLYKNSEEKQ